MIEWKAVHMRGCWSLNVGIETELKQTEKLSVAPVLPLLVLSACDEEGLTTIIGWW